jgi:hypothetical protein
VASVKGMVHLRGRKLAAILIGTSAVIGAVVGRGWAELPWVSPSLLGAPTDRALMTTAVRSWARSPDC